MEGVEAGKVTLIISIQGLVDQPYLIIIKIVFYCRCLQRRQDRHCPYPKHQLLKFRDSSITLSMSQDMSFQNLEITNRIFLPGFPCLFSLLSSFLHLKLGHLFFHMFKGFTRTWPIASLWDFSFQVFLITSFQQFQHRHLYTFCNEAPWAPKDFWVILCLTKILWRTKTAYLTHYHLCSLGV